MAETTRYSPMTTYSRTALSESESGSDMDEDDKINKFVKEVFRKIYDNVLNYLEPVPVLDVFQSEHVFGDNTTVQVRGLMEQPDTSSKNREIHKYFQANPDKYVTFKSALVRTGQSGLLEKIEMAETEIHEKIKEGKHGCHCTNASNCPWLKKMKCPENLTPFVSSEILHFAEKVLDHIYDNVLEDLEPVKVLDVFQAERVFGNKTNVKVRDIRDKPDTSSKIREIHKYFKANPDKYVGFKSALVRTGQSGLLKTIEMREAEIHEKLKGEESECNCTDSGNCPLLKALKCPDDIKPFVPSEIARIRNEIIRLYERLHQKTPIYPLRPSRKFKIEDLYVQPHMLVVDPRGRCALKDKDKRSHADKSKKVKVKVDNIQDLFCSEDCNLCHEIYVEGEAGMGKSCLCEHLVNLWVRCQTGSTPLLGDDNFIKTFAFLFYVPLREVNRKNKECHNVDEMIKSQLQLSDCDLSTLMSEYCCLIILDGLDEIRDLPERTHRDKCVYLTTSRPFKLELLAPELEDIGIDRQISITGIKQTSQKDLTNKVVSLLNEEHSENKAADQFIRDIEEQDLTQYLETPVLLMQMLGLWHSGKPLGSSQCAIYSNMVEKQIEFTEKVRGISKEQTDTMTCQDQLPACLANQRFCQKYKSVLLKVSKLAYERLLDKDQESSLIFDHEQTEICGMKDAEVNKLLEMGILTQHKVLGKIVEELKSVSFLHKSHQEFFCALHLSTKCQSSELSKLFSEVVSDLDRVLELEKIFLFICGMNANVAADISEFIMEKVSSDDRVQIYRQHFGGDNTLIKRIQALILAGAEEARKNQQSIAALKVQDIYDEFDWQDVSKIFACDTSHAKSIFMSSPADVTSWPPSSCLEKIYLLNVDITACDVFTKNFDGSALSLLYLNNVALTRDQVNALYTNLSSTQNIKKVRIVDSSCTTREDSGNEVSIGLDFSRHKNLETLGLGDLSVGEITLLLSPESKTLKLVWLYGVYFSAARFRDTMKSLPRNGVEINLGDPVYGPLKVRGKDAAEKTLNDIRQAEYTKVMVDNVEYSGDVCVVRSFVFYNNE